MKQRLILAVVMAGCMMLALVQAQDDPPAIGKPPRPVTVPTDLMFKHGMEKVAELIEEKNWEDAIETLQLILNKTENLLVPVARKGKARAWVPIHAEANRLLGSMPKAGKDLYEQQFGPSAEADLNKAKNDPAKLAKVARRYLHTKAGPVALQLLAAYHAEHGQSHLAAAGFLQMLDRRGLEKLDGSTLYQMARAFLLTGATPAGERAWRQLVKRQQAGKLDRHIPLEMLREQIDQLDKKNAADAPPWPEYRGGPSRTEERKGGPPAMKAEFYTPLQESDHKKFSKFLEEAKDSLEKRRLPLLPAFSPIVVNGRACYRGYAGVYAIGLRTGKISWTTEAEGGPELINRVLTRKIVQDWLQQFSQNNSLEILVENSVIGTLSTDGQRVFMVDDLIIPPYLPRRVSSFDRNDRQRTSTSSDPEDFPRKDIELRKLLSKIPAPVQAQVRGNILRAMAAGPVSDEEEGGKLLWELPSPWDKKCPFKESFFLAPPLPLDGRLYVLNEKEAMVRLVCLEPSDDPEKAITTQPHVIWIQPLCKLLDRVELNLQRRLNAAHLAYADGILVCPTNAGVVFGVDLLSHEVLWVHAYRPEALEPVGSKTKDRKKDEKKQGKKGDKEGDQPMPKPAEAQAPWAATAPAIRDGKVVFTAPDGDSITCLNLRDGQLVWRQPRKQDDCYFAGIYSGKALIVGKAGCRALQLADGKRAWQTATGFPSGQGAASENVYYLPLQKGLKGKPEICALDIASGKVTSRIAVPELDGQKQPCIPGNLVFTNGHMLSQSSTQLIAYPQAKAQQKEVEGRLKKNPRDVEALIDRGRLNHAAGKLQAAYDDLRLALDCKPADRLAATVRDSLFEVLMDLLAKDFTKEEKHLAECWQLCQEGVPEEQTRRKVAYLALVEQKRAEQGRALDALQACFDLAALAAKDELLAIPGMAGCKVRPALWARAQITRLFQAARPAEHKQMEARIHELGKAASKGKDRQALTRFIQMFGMESSTVRQAVLQLADQVIADPAASALDQRQIELFLLDLRAHQGDKESAGRAVDCLARLMVRLGNFEAAGVWYQEMKRDYASTPIRNGKTGAHLWTDLLTDKRLMPFLTRSAKRQPWTELRASRQPTTVRSILPLRRLGGLPPGQDWLFAYDLLQRHLQIRDQAGARQDYTVDVSRQPALPYLESSYRGSWQMVGSIAIVEVCPLVVAVDPARRQELWQFNFYSPMSNLAQQKLSGLRIVSSAGIVLLVKDKLVCLDPLTGKVSWEVAADPFAHVFGDGRLVCILETDSGGSKVPVRALSTSDGRPVSVADFTKAVDKRVQIMGSQLLVREDKPGKEVVLRLHDVASGKDVWKESFPDKSIVLTSQDTRLTGVIRPDGKLTVVDLKTRKPVLQASLVFEGSLNTIKEILDGVTHAHLLRYDEHFCIALNKSGRADADAPYVLPCLPVNGMVYAFERNGELTWAEQMPSTYLVLDAFREVPFVTFTCYQAIPKFKVRPGVRMVGRPTEVSVKCIDKKTGKILYSDQFPANEWFQSLVPNKNAGTVDIVGRNASIHFAADR